MHAYCTHAKKNNTENIAAVCHKKKNASTYICHNITNPSIHKHTHKQYKPNAPPTQAQMDDVSKHISRQKILIIFEPFFPASVVADASYVHARCCSWATSRHRLGLA